MLYFFNKTITIGLYLVCVESLPLLKHAPKNYNYFNKLIVNGNKNMKITKLKNLLKSFHSIIILAYLKFVQSEAF